MQINIDGVEFGYSSTPVLKEINLDINGPQLLSIIGPNGVGKSTLIHCINKILSPTKGTVLLDGKDVKECTLKDLVKIIGYVPYSANDTFPLSVVDTVLMGRHPHSHWKSLDSDLDVVYETLKLINIEHLEMRIFNELSAGQHQKVLLARGLVQEPKILLLDEPTSNLDIKHQMEVTRIMRNLSQERNIIVIMISHDLNIAAKYSDNMLMLKDGYVYAVGTPEEVLTKENIKAVYDVDSEVVMSHGRPHIIMIDPEFDDHIEPVAPEVFVKSERHHTVNTEPEIPASAVQTE